ncbi:C40 family peptidase [Paenibacillus abyssi]|uniref:NlpC/P60 domain-containing protein n=1 Tax=Paenibacillus abyssi TaxID=1340531 RepID=A0A917G7G1_9BACL|nr:C40 family peptidase [Paenibacillus abyssi]GGG26657.1 hypothetical protein GCM10010916_48830 [Paenibacillus abyssi]
MKRWRWLIVLLCMMMIMQLSACSWRGGDGPSNRDGSGNIGMLETGQSAVDVIDLGGTPYVDVSKMAGLMGFQADWSEDGTQLLIGDHDVIWSFQPDSRTVVKEEQKILMDAPAHKRQSSLVIPSSAVQPLFGDEAVFTVDSNRVSIFPTPDYVDPDAAQGDAFQDDLQDPSLKPSLRAEDSGTSITPQSVEMFAATGSKIIADARKYIGVPYKFGAGPYNQTKRFDCSSYTRFIYAKHGYNLPRTARAQAVKGTYVPRSKLRTGDLMYFYVPGRFKSNKKIGHVGIYMGNQKMIHSSPLPEDGVQITNINKAYWKKTYLYAKRLIK